jgi:hypothetical protein
MESTSSKKGLMAGSCEHANEISGNLRGRELLDLLIDYLIEDPARSMLR